MIKNQPPMFLYSTLLYRRATASSQVALARETSSGTTTALHYVKESGEELRDMPMLDCKEECAE